MPRIFTFQFSLPTTYLNTSKIFKKKSLVSISKDYSKYSYHTLISFRNFYLSPRYLSPHLKSTLCTYLKQKEKRYVSLKSMEKPHPPIPILETLSKTIQKLNFKSPPPPPSKDSLRKSWENANRRGIGRNPRQSRGSINYLTNLSASWEPSLFLLLPFPQTLAHPVLPATTV